ncbi:MAG: indole-3-glycerol phosphate synthase TrpC, partial [Elusimicrobia bacterium]|nr:indole-3-glycerol phosphate synthase TrpC [Elusimicrobiota bacterium]
LNKIVFKKKQELKKIKEKYPLEKIKAKAKKGKTRNFFKALNKAPYSIIAEIKKASPTEGVIVKRFSPSILARVYEKAGADAISVLTEEKFFLGNLDNIQKVKSASRIPVLRKDFIFDEYQIYESKVSGADAVLLILRILERRQFERLFFLAKKLGLDVLVEIYDRKDLSKLKIKADIIGINTRDLKTGKINFEKTGKLIKEINSQICVCESGVGNKSHIDEMKKIGFNCFLVGTSILRSKDKVHFIRSLLK